MQKSARIAKIATEVTRA